MGSWYGRARVQGPRGDVGGLQDTVTARQMHVLSAEFWLYVDDVRAVLKVYQRSCQGICCCILLGRASQAFA